MVTASGLQRQTTWSDQAIMHAHEADSPVILQSSHARNMLEKTSRHLILAAVETYPPYPHCHAPDHGNSPSTCYSAIRHGFT